MIYGLQSHKASCSGAPALGCVSARLLREVVTTALCCRALKIATDVASGLAFVHTSQVMHLDLKWGCCLPTVRH